MKFRKKPVVIEAVQFTDPGLYPVYAKFCGESIGALQNNQDMTEWRLQIVTLEGLMTASLGDWLIKGIKGEIYPCKADIFEATYEPVVEPPSAEKYFGGFTGQEDGLE